MEPARNTLNVLLQDALSQPTAPFRESWTRATFFKNCIERKTTHWIDPVGNLWLGARSLKDVRKSRLLFVAHLDHPGFVVDRFYRKKNRCFADATWLGGGPMDIRNINVTVFSEFHAGVRIRGKIVETEPGIRSVSRAVIELENNEMVSSIVQNPATSMKDLGPWGACLQYKECPDGVRFKKGECITKAADDLVGACAIAAAFFDKKPRPGVVACLTRAEESGFHGALEVLRKGWLSNRTTKMISIETSAWRPGAELGKGPVVRQGDRVSLFDHSLVEWIDQTAAEIRKKDQNFLFQKRVMDGGACEASAFRVFGFEVAGISTPLQNYHNIDPQKRAKPEIVRLSDVEGLYELLCRLVTSYSPTLLEKIRRQPLAKFKKDILKNHRGHLKHF